MRRLKAFSLIELLVSTFLVLVLVIGSMFFVSGLWRGFVGFYKEWENINEARQGVNEIAQELREARLGEEGSFLLEKAEDKEIVFFADIDDDGEIERVRYFLGSVTQQEEMLECFSTIKGGDCSVVFSGLPSGISQAKLKIFVEGDLGYSAEKISISIDGSFAGNSCEQGCQDCAGMWQGASSFNVVSLVQDGNLQVYFSATPWVDPICSWGVPGHSFRARAVLSYITESGPLTELKKGVIEPVGSPPFYPLTQEKVTTISRYIASSPPVFYYFDKTGAEITDPSLRIKNTRAIKVSLLADKDPQRDPKPVLLEKMIYLRNK